MEQTAKDKELEYFKQELEKWRQIAQDHSRADVKTDIVYNKAILATAKNEWEALENDLHIKAKATLVCAKEMLTRELLAVDGQAQDKLLGFLKWRTELSARLAETISTLESAGKSD